MDLLVLKNQALALAFNVLSWLRALLPEFLRAKRPAAPGEECARCVQIEGPGGLDQLRLVPLRDHESTSGYNLKGSRNTRSDIAIEDHMVLVCVKNFSVNFADVTIRWGLYESALRYVGWPIVPGFDFSGTVIKAGKASKFSEGDMVFGYTLFGAYSTRLLVPARQIRRVPSCLDMKTAAALPAVAGTALHAMKLAGAWPQKPLTKNRAVLIHSAAGGVGSTLVQMAKLCGCSPIVGVVGSPFKIDVCRKMGADVVICRASMDLWREARKASPEGYMAIFDANGVATLKQSYQHLSQCGRLIVYGFHTNLPKASQYLSPWNWIKMAWGMLNMPSFDAMDMCLSSKAVLGFNLSFFSKEDEMTTAYLDQVLRWVEERKLRTPTISVFPMHKVGEAHALIQSGKSVGKLVISTGATSPKEEKK